MFNEIETINQGEIEAMKSEVSNLKLLVEKLRRDQQVMLATPQQRINLLSEMQADQEMMCEWLLNLHGDEHIPFAHKVARGKNKQLIQSLLSLISSLYGAGKTPFFTTLDRDGNTFGHCLLGFINKEKTTDPRVNSDLVEAYFDCLKDLLYDVKIQVSQLVNQDGHRMVDLIVKHHDSKALNAFLDWVNEFEHDIQQPILYALVCPLIYEFDVGKLGNFMKYVSRTLSTQRLNDIWVDQPFDYNKITANWNDDKVDGYFELIQALPEAMQPGLLSSFGLELYKKSRWGQFKEYLVHFCKQHEAVQLTSLTLHHTKYETRAWAEVWGGKLIECMFYTHFNPLSEAAFKNSPLLANIVFYIVGARNDSPTGRSLVKLLIQNTPALHLYFNMLSGHPQEKRVYMLIANEDQRTIIGEHVARCGDKTVYDYLMCLGEISLPIVFSKAKRGGVVDYISNMTNADEQLQVQRLLKNHESAFYQFLSDTPTPMSSIFVCLPPEENRYIQEIYALKPNLAPSSEIYQPVIDQSVDAKDESHSLYFLSNINANQPLGGLRNRGKPHEEIPVSFKMDNRL